MTTIRETVRRRAFTLIELLVVMFLIALLAGLAVLIIPNLNDQARAPRGAVMLQQWLLTAKNRALRDRAPRGVRLLVSGSNPNQVTDLQYIEQPDDFIVQPGVVADPFNPAGLLPFRRISSTGADLTKVVLEGTGTPDFSGGNADRTLWPVQPGDYLVVNGGLPHQIVSLPDKVTLQLASPLPAQVTTVANYRIQRAPRVVGDEPLQLPADIVIDLSTNATYGNPLPVSTIYDPVTKTSTSTIDILFSPSGAVISRGTATDAIYLWVRDSTLGLFEGDNSVVAIQVRSGATFAFPVDNTPSGDPYSIAKTGRVPQS